MNLSAADLLPGESVLAAAQLHAASSMRIKVPRVAEAQVSLECKLLSEQALGSSTLFIGEVGMFHVADQLLGPRSHVENFAPIGRLGSPSVYCRSTDRFDVARISYAK